MVSCVFEKLLLEPPLVEFDEALHALALYHHHYQLNYLLLVFAQVLQTEEEQQLEVFEDVGIFALHQLYVVLGELERGSFEVHVAWRAGKHKAEVDVNDVSIHINQDVVVMPVLDVKEVLDEAVTCQTLDEVGYGGLPVHTEDLFIDVFETALMRHLFQVAYCASVVYEFDEPAVSAKRNDGVGANPDFDVLFEEDLVDEADELHGHVLLPQVVA